MARNPARRTALADAGITVLAEQGARGLTHRAVDAEAGVPRGTASNYFASRDDLVGALVARIEERLTPDPAVAAAAPAEGTDRERLAHHLRDVVRRLTADPHVALALFELRLEAARRPEVARTLGAWRRSAFTDDVTFHAAAGLPGGRADLALVHHAVDGLVLDRLTVPLDPGADLDEVVDALAGRLLP
ncbi:TetR/AcrR family transcriptional regulator [uncultured Nocardioides sp.]|uniref:TetR/AcrR family transcriptional regulator n=1 Tax=uncultured Nocardioides sp. TaxID=198441 RepID=UPI0026273288|nr:TetR/AcrR family transcriptional regulator [uncultured Nocardioides sp.]